MGKNIIEFKFKVKDLEVRDCGKCAEIVKWCSDDGKEYCYTIAFWNKNKESYDLKFVGNRPFDKDINSKLFMKLAKQGQQILDNPFF